MDRGTDESQKMLDCMVCALFTTESGSVNLTIWGDDEVVSVELSREKAALVAAGITHYIQQHLRVAFSATNESAGSNNANDHENTSHDVEQNPETARQTVVVGDGVAHNAWENPSPLLERMVDPFADGDKNETSGYGGQGMVANDTDFYSEGQDEQNG